jgi:Arabinose efflux permease
MQNWGILSKNRTYRNLWIAKVGSQFGDWFNQVALAQITLQLTHSALIMGIVLLCRSLPAVVLSPFVGPLVDRFPKPPLLFVTDVLRAVFAFGYALVLIFHASWLLYLSSLLLGIAGIFFDPARNAAIPFVVAPEDLTAAYALESGTTGVLQIFGATAGGIVAIAVSPVVCFAINAASYLWSALCILRTQWPEFYATKQLPDSYVHALNAGFHESVHNRTARSIIFIGISWGLAGGGYYILIPLLGTQTFHLGGLGIGLLYAIDGIGVLIGSYLVHRIVGDNHRRAIVWYGIAYITQALFFGLLTQSTFFLLGALMLLLMRASSGVIIPLDSYLLQSSSKPDMRGRLFALHSATYGGVMQVSYVLAGYAFAHIGIPVAGLLIASISLLCGISWLLQFATRGNVA